MFGSDKGSEDGDNLGDVDEEIDVDGRVGVERRDEVDEGGIGECCPGVEGSVGDNLGDVEEDEDEDDDEAEEEAEDEDDEDADEGE